MTVLTTVSEQVYKVWYRAYEKCYRKYQTSETDYVQNYPTTFKIINMSFMNIKYTYVKTVLGWIGLEVKVKRNLSFPKRNKEDGSGKFNSLLP